MRSSIAKVHHKVLLIDEILKDQTSNAKYVVTWEKNARKVNKGCNEIYMERKHEE